MAESITPEMRELQQQVYEGAQSEGFQLPGRSEWSNFETQLAGSKDTAGADIGMSGEMYVPVGEDGRLVNPAAHRAPGDPPSTHLLKIHITPFVEFGDDGDVAHIRWIASVSVIELTKNRMVIADDSADEQAIKAMQAGRPYLEYMNDPEYREARLGFHHDNPRDAVSAALRKISSGGAINLPPAPATRAPAAAPPATEPAESPRPPLLLIGALGAAIAAVIAFFVFAGGGGDDEPDEIAIGTAGVTEATPAPTSATIPSTEPVTTTTTATTTTTTTATSTTTSTTSTIPATEFAIVDQRCFDTATGNSTDTCVFPTGVTRSGLDPVTVTAHLPDPSVLGPESIGVISMYLTDGPANDVLVECTTRGECVSWMGPSFFGIETVWQPQNFFALHSEVGFVFSIVNRAEEVGLLVPEVASADGTVVPEGEYTISEASIMIEHEGTRSISLFGTETTFWFK